MILFPKTVLYWTPKHAIIELNIPENTGQQISGSAEHETPLTLPAYTFTPESSMTH